MTVIDHVRTLTGCEAVGIRLHDDGDYPYYVYDGFPESFILHEMSLCGRDYEGFRLLDPSGEGYLLECMCGNVIRGRTDPALPFFTENGSFYSNHTTKLLATTTEDDRQSHTRNYCNSSGYETVALVPIRAHGETIGLIQINDMQTDMLDEETMATLELIGGQVGLAVQNSLVHSKLKSALEEIETLRGILPICASCKKVRNDEGYWEAVDTYLHHHSDLRFTHGLCPECIAKLYPELKKPLLNPIE